MSYDFVITSNEKKKEYTFRGLLCIWYNMYTKTVLKKTNYQMINIYL